MVGWRLSRPVPLPPSVTRWSMLTLSPTTAVSPITTPVAWSISTPRPILRPITEVKSDVEDNRLV